MLRFYVNFNAEDEYVYIDNVRIYEQPLPADESVHLKIDGKQVKDLKIPEGNLIILINRDDKFFVPTGSTVLRETDMLSVLADKEAIQKINVMIDEFGK